MFLIFQKHLLLTFIRVLAFFFFVFLGGEIFAHHAGEGQNMISSTRFVDPFTGKREKPSDYFLITQDFQKGTIDNSNLHTTTVFGEFNFAGGKFAANFSAPWTYYEQKDRSDAARYGKAFVGAKWNPLIDTGWPFFVILEGRLGFPSGGDTDKFAGGDYYSGIANLTLGATWKQFLFVLRGSGIFPLSKDHANLDTQSGLPYWAQSSTSSTQNTEEHPEIQKITQWFAYVTYFWTKDFSVFGGVLYRTPYVNVIGGGSLLEEDSETQKKFPKAFKEASLGFNYTLTKGTYLTIAGRLPLIRDPEIRLYDYAITTSISFELPEWRESSKKSEKEAEEFESEDDLEKK
ncbi:LIC11086 family outer membrane transporter [Leptospira licerasiae]|uniref:Transporter n=1 Tax=Leptospira licerasiae str. MMD4847 TaxID=1049971 RepID=A0ABP2RCW4_9LEPT|nr:hypothetical protein [Leptospira licerasiae]EIE03415.1 hypothetical protein LEP1GSC185_0038 [Leptospira licerasiae serovar Varillal str. VAR 010]EJZ42223.1 hypothetical protein LEP1GSC178_2393 [Leptospira licerasiae str. MMD4847]